MKRKCIKTHRPDKITQQLKVLLIILCFVSFSPLRILASMGDGEFFSSLNLNYPGLDSVKMALNSDRKSVV